MLAQRTLGTVTHYPPVFIALLLFDRDENRLRFFFNAIFLDAIPQPTVAPDAMKNVPTTKLDVPPFAAQRQPSKTIAIDKANEHINHAAFLDLISFRIIDLLMPTSVMRVYAGRDLEVTEVTKAVTCA